MMRINELMRYQKGILLLLVAMLILFTVLYCVVTSRVGFLYHEEIFVPREENGSMIYSATVRGKDCRFTVTTEGAVLFQYGEKTYGPYTAKEDPTAIPKDHDRAAHMSGLEVKDGEEILFRGGVIKLGDSKIPDLFYDEDGQIGLSVIITSANGTVVDGHGNVIDPMEPTIRTILELINGPELTRKGHWLAWFCAVILSVVTAINIIFEDEIFRLSLLFKVQDVDLVEPSDWVLAARPIAYALCTIMVLVVYIQGLQ